MINNLKETCRTCGSKLIQRETMRKASQLKQPYYYTAYYFCPSCKKIYHNDKFKIINENFDLFTNHHVAPTNFDIEIWTDGACVNNGRENARAAWAFVTKDHEASGLVVGKQTNNTAEALAIHHALLWAAEQGSQKIKIYSDSQITIHNMQKGLEKIKGNQEIFQKIYNLIHKHNLEVVYEKVLGHSGNENNERADWLANSLADVKQGRSL